MLVVGRDVLEITFCFGVFLQITFFLLVVGRDCGEKMFYFVHCNISQECTHRAIEVQVFF